MNHLLLDVITFWGFLQKKNAHKFQKGWDEKRHFPDVRQGYEKFSRVLLELPARCRATCGGATPQRPRLYRTLTITFCTNSAEHHF